jgi:hypothetical protein
MKGKRKRKTNPSNNKQRSAEGLMHITNSLRVQEEEFAQLKYSDVQPSAAVGLSETQRSEPDRSIRPRTTDNTIGILLNNTNFYILSAKRRKEINKAKYRKKLLPVPFLFSF